MKDKFVHDIESARAEWANQIIGERDRLRAEVEILVWNLAGISTMACRRTPILYNGEMARPALDEVAELVKDYARLRAANAELERKLNDIAGDAAKNLVDATAQNDENKRLRAVNAELVAILADALEWGMTSKHFDAGRSLKNGEDARAALSRAEQAKPEPETCVWKYDAVEGEWQTSCDHEEYFEGYDPINTDFYTNCPFCGRRIEVK